MPPSRARSPMSRTTKDRAPESGPKAHSPPSPDGRASLDGAPALVMRARVPPQRTQSDAAAVQFCPPAARRTHGEPAPADRLPRRALSLRHLRGVDVPDPACRTPVHPAAPSGGRSLRSYRPAGPPACKKTAGFSLPSPPDEGPAQSAQAAKEIPAPAVNSSSRTLAAPVRLPGPAFHQSW